MERWEVVRYSCEMWMKVFPTWSECMVQNQSKKKRNEEIDKPQVICTSNKLCFAWFVFSSFKDSCHRYDCGHFRARCWFDYIIRGKQFFSHLPNEFHLFSGEFPKESAFKERKNTHTQTLTCMSLRLFTRRHCRRFNKQKDGSIEDNTFRVHSSTMIAFIVNFPTLPWHYCAIIVESIQLYKNR